mmetsp:Transcript_79185/g.154848  ORF Transcript_79185/g.154848 Transcript_79185/m.154848 type:complete len:218 (-) Transcript_79185:683-1336(-)
MVVDTAAVGDGGATVVVNVVASSDGSGGGDFGDRVRTLSLLLLLLLKFFHLSLQISYLCRRRHRCCFCCFRCLFSRRRRRRFLCSSNLNLDDNSSFSSSFSSSNRPVCLCLGCHDTGTLLRSQRRLKLLALFLPSGGLAQSSLALGRKCLSFRFPARGFACVLAVQRHALGSPLLLRRFSRGVRGVHSPLVGFRETHRPATAETTVTSRRRRRRRRR